MCRTRGAPGSVSCPLDVQLRGPAPVPSMPQVGKGVRAARHSRPRAVLGVSPGSPAQGVTVTQGEHVTT